MITGNLEIKKVLIGYGLSDDEVRVYLAVLSSGGATARELSKISGIKRTTIYLITERLVSKGIISQYKAKYGTHYAAPEPENLILRLENIKSEVRSILPQLKALEKKDYYEPSIKFYRGKMGYMEILEDTLKNPCSEILSIGSEEDLNIVISEKYALGSYIPRRIKKKIKLKQLVLPNKFSKSLKKRDKKELRRIKFLPEKFNFSANIIIYQNKVAYLTSKRELVGIVIESPEIAQLEKEKFRILWRSL